MDVESNSFEIWESIYANEDTQLEDMLPSIVAKPATDPTPSLNGGATVTPESDWEFAITEREV